MGGEIVSRRLRKLPTSMTGVQNSSNSILEIIAGRLLRLGSKNLVYVD
jgi:hypothetical protein